MTSGEYAKKMCRDEGAVMEARLRAAFEAGVERASKVCAQLEEAEASLKKAGELIHDEFCGDTHHMFCFDARAYFEKHPK